MATRSKSWCVASDPGCVAISSGCVAMCLRFVATGQDVWHRFMFCCHRPGICIQVQNEGPQIPDVVG